MRQDDVFSLRWNGVRPDATRLMGSDGARECVGKSLLLVRVVRVREAEVREGRCGQP